MTLELPDASLRLTHIVRYSKMLLSGYMEETPKRQLDRLSAHGNIALTSCNEKVFSAAVGAILGDMMDIIGGEDMAVEKLPAQTPVKRKGRPRKGASTPSTTSIETEQMTTQDKITDIDTSSKTTAPSRFNLLKCLLHLLQRSEGWSHRELAKVIQNIQSEVIATEE